MTRLLPRLLCLLAAAALLWGCAPSADETATASAGNPLLEPYDTPYEVPPFDRIAVEHYEPAFAEAMRREVEEHRAIAGNPEPPTFENTIAALDRSGVLLGEISAVFFSLSGQDTGPELQAVNRRITPLLAAHRDALRLDPAIFARVRAVYDARASLDLDDEQRFLLENVYRGYVRDGALLDDAAQTRLKEINAALAELRVSFSDNLLAETNGFELVIDDPADLAGLPESVIEAAAADEPGRWVFTTQRPSCNPFLTYAENRELRRRLFEAYTTRGMHGDERDNTGILKEIVNLRLERARLLGYDTYADYVLENRMAGTPERVFDLLDRLWEAAIPVARREVAAMQALIDAEGGGFELAPWDWRYYAEKVRKAEYDLDDAELRPYFPLERVRDGAFAVAHRLYGLTFERLDDVPLPHEEAQAFRVEEADGSHCAVMYMDFHPRPGKRGGAWCGGFRAQNRADGTEVDPIINLVCNFTRPTGDAPALLSLSEVETLFHEFGHALDGMLSDVTYRSLFRSTDFSELPSQIMEHWAEEPAVMKEYARHHETGEPIPDDLIARIEASGRFNQGFATVEYLAASLLDMELHGRTEPVEGDLVDLETRLFEERGLIPEIVSRYRTGYFGHIVGGYAAGYYGYIWCGVLDNDAFEAFRETSLYDQATARRFRDTILARNGTADYLRMYRDFRGRDPEIEPLLRKRGLI